MLVLDRAQTPGMTCESIGPERSHIPTEWPVVDEKGALVRVAAVRPLRPGDAEEFVDLHLGGMTMEDNYMRFGCHMDPVTAAANALKYSPIGEHAGPRDFGFVALVGGKVVGQASCMQSDEYGAQGFDFSVAVHKDWRRRRVLPAGEKGAAPKTLAGALMLRLFQAAEANPDVAVLGAEILTDNTPSNRLVEHTASLMGWKARKTTSDGWNYLRYTL